MRPSQMERPTRDDFRLDEPIPFIATPRGQGGRSPKTGAPEVPQHGPTLRLVATHDTGEGRRRLAARACKQRKESNKSFFSND